MQRINFRRLFGRLKRVELEKIRLLTSARNPFVYGDDVQEAKKNRLPIVALESTIITHGMPYPDNLKTAINVEEVVRKKGAVPATIAILNGQVHVGLNHEQLEVLSKTDRMKTIKCSRRDLSAIVSWKLNGGTTVSATMLVAHLSGIPIMATGGIGGVHRGAELTFDVSTDLTELGRTPVAVVCSGVKSILDIGKTLEYLETQGVPVVKIGETDDFPAFYCTETYDKLKAPYRISNANAAAQLLNAQRELGLETGMLFAVPIPAEYSLSPKEVESAICEALEEAKSRGVTGKSVTPFLLEEMNKITGGQSLRSNIALIENNASVAAEIAVALAEGCQVGPVEEATCVLKSGKSPVVIGGSVMDTTLQVTDLEIKNDGRTHAGTSRESCGGVGRNIANALISLGLNGTRLISVVGNDRPGKAIIKSLGDGAQTVEQLSNMNTARYTGIVDFRGECCFGIGEMEFSAISTDLVKKYQSRVEEASFIVLDGNLPLPTIRLILDIAASSKIPVWYEPTDVRKATKVFEAGPQWQNVLHFVSPNRDELYRIAKYFGIQVSDRKLSMNLEDVKTIVEQVAEFVPVVVSTLGSQGVMVVRKALESEPFYNTDGRLIAGTLTRSRLYPPLSHTSKNQNEPFNVSGCGDCLTAGIICGIHKNMDETGCLSLALKAAALSLTSFDAVPASLSMLCDAKC